MAPRGTDDFATGPINYGSHSGTALHPLQGRGIHPSEGSGHPPSLRSLQLALRSEPPLTGHLTLRLWSLSPSEGFPSSGGRAKETPSDTRQRGD